METQAPVTASALTEQEHEMLKAFVQSPAYPVVKKLYENGIFVMYRQLEQCKETKDVFQQIGQIKGLRWAQNIPAMAVQAHEDSQIRKVERIAKDKVRGPRT